MKKKWIPGLFDFGQYFTGSARIFRIGVELVKKLFFLASLPIIRNYHPWTKTSKTRMYWIPVNQSIERPENVPLPYKLVEDFIDKSAYRVILDFCGCRKAYKCKNFPTDIGCLMIGEDAKFIAPKISRSVTKEEARSHLHKAMNAHLPAFVGAGRVDNFVFGAPDNGKLLTICFCCSCCCISSAVSSLPKARQKKLLNRLDGLNILVDSEKCIGCGVCANECFAHEISIVNDKAVIPEDCFGCGRCAEACPQNAISISLNNPDFIAQAVDRIREYVDC